MKKNIFRVNKHRYFWIYCLAMIMALFIFSTKEIYATEDNSDYIEIRTVEDLYNIRNNMEGNYKLMNDIDLSEATSSGNGWNPIGSNNTYSGIPFTGIFDGQGYEIKGLRINNIQKKLDSSDITYIGLFAYNMGCICNVNFTSVNIYAKDTRDGGSLYVGCVSGKNDGIISNVNVISGSVKGAIVGAVSKWGYVNWRTGVSVSGISGRSSGSITDCANSADVYAEVSGDSSTGKRADGNVSGIAWGDNNSIISNCFNNGSVSYKKTNSYTDASSCGITNQGTVSNCYNTASTDYGICSSGETINCYFVGNGKTNSNATNCYYCGTASGNSGWTQLTKSQMQLLDSFSGFDFNDTWSFLDDSSYLYPVLVNHEYVAPTVPQVQAPKVESLQIKSLPDKTSYIEGQSFEPKGLVINAIYNDGTIIECKDYSINEIDTTVGNKTIFVSYNSVNTSFDITYSPKELTNIKVTTGPEKTIYNEGETFDKTGMVVKATYNNGDVVVIDDYSVGDIIGFGQVDVEISYGGLTTTTKVTVRKIVKSVSLDNYEIEMYQKEKKNLNVTYNPNDAYNQEVVWTSSDESVAIVNENGEVEGIDEGTADIRATLKGSDTIFAICKVKVKALEVVDIEIAKQPNKKRYVVGEDFDPTGMLVNYIYNNGTKDVCNDYLIESIDGVGNVNVVITWDKYTKTVPVSVVTVDDIEIASLPYKTNYVEGESFDASGLIVNVVYSDKVKEKCTNYVVGDISGLGDVQIPISYAGFVKYIDVFVSKSTSTDSGIIYASVLKNSNIREIKLKNDAKLIMDTDISLDGIMKYNYSVKPNIIIEGDGKLTVKYISLNDYTQESGTNVVISDGGLTANDVIISKDAVLYTTGDTLGASALVARYIDSSGNVQVYSNSSDVRAMIAFGLTINDGKFMVHAYKKCFSSGDVFINAGELYLERVSTVGEIFDSTSFNMSDELHIETPDSGRYISKTIVDQYGSSLIDVVYIKKKTDSSSTNNGQNTPISDGTTNNSNNLNNSKASNKTSVNLGTKKDSSKSSVKINKSKYSNEWINGKWYDKDGRQTYSGKLTWRSNSKGWWVEDTAGWYPQNQWQKIDGIWYFFKPDGYMASQEYYDGYWFNKDGSWDSQYYLTWKSNSKGWWVEDKSGWWPANKWLKIDGSWYYFNGAGYMATSQYVDGYWVGANGVCQ